jgi:hypothetical protein
VPCSTGPIARPTPPTRSRCSERAVSLDPNFALAYAALGDAYLELYKAKRDPVHASKANDAVMRAPADQPG